MFHEKAIVFLRSLFRRWKTLGVSHLLSIVLFCRCFVDGEQLSSNPQGQATPQQTLLSRVLRLLGRPGFWLYIGTSLMAIAGWYWHAHQLGQASGLSFGFWGTGADRSSISLLLDLNGWINLLLRVCLRLLALVGVPFLLIGLRTSWRSGGGQIAISGLVGVLLCTIATMRSSTIHEYYQLPLLLFSSPLIGLGWQTWHQRRPRWQPRLFQTKRDEAA